MIKHSSHLQALAAALLLTLSGGVLGAAAPATPNTIDLSATPPDLTLAVAPNLILTYDDSGSMSVSYVPGILGDGDPQYGLNAGYIKDPASGGKMCTWYGVTGTGTTAFKDPIPGIHPWAFSAAVNTLYYDPNVTYTPPRKIDGTAMPDSKYTAAWNDGIAANSGGSTAARDLSTAYQVSWSGSTPRPDVIRNAAAASASTACAAAARITDKNSADYNLSIGYMPFPTGASRAFYYVLKSGVDASNTANLYKPANYTAVDVGALTATQQTNFANWYSYYRSRNLAARTSVSRAFQAIPSNIRIQWQRLNTSGLANSAILKSLSDATQRTNFFKFLYASAPSGGTPTRGATERVMRYLGPGNANNNDNDPYYDSFYKKELTCRRNYHLLVTDGGWKDDYTAASTKNGVTTPEKYFTLNSVANAATAATDQNADQAAITLPDGRKYVPTSKAATIFGSGPDQTGRPGFADQAFYYWATPLRTFAKNNVVPYIPDKTTGITGDPVTTAIGNDPTKLPDEVYFNPANDPATWPHLTQFIVAFGLGGSLNFPGDLKALRQGTKVWTAWDSAAAMNELQDVPEKADDTWHAAINSRGGLFSANNPQQLIDQLLAVINSIVTRETAPVASALNTAVLGVNAVTYVTGFNSTDYSGSVVAKSVDGSGNVGAVLWDAAALLDARAPSDRVILTSAFNSSKKLVGTAFTWSDTSDLGVNLKTVDSRYTSDGNAQKRTDYLRGLRTDENTTFRARGSVVGAIIDSQAVYVAYPAAGYSDSWPASDPESATDSSKKPLYSYTAFANTWAKRAPTLYVGANDGMLHAFDATLASDKYTGAASDTVDRAPSPGKERWAYIPNAVFNHLYDLTVVNNYKFIPTVDATPVVRDVFFSSGTQGWHSILIGGLRMGGRGVYALDITDPSATEAGASSKVLWEFNSSVASTTAGNPANLGYTYGRPNVGRLANKKWVVLIPSGYFPTGTDCTAVPAACNTTSSLFVVDAQTGALIKELKTPAGTTSYGLASPVLGDYNSDQVDDVAFAGDLQGQLWRFDLTNADPTKWTVDLAYQPSTDHLGKRPITVMPRLFADPNSQNFIVVFGTGKYLGGSDNTIDSTTPVQGVYGIREAGKTGQAAVQEGSLIQQKMTEVDQIRGLTTKAVPLVDANNKAVGGWYFDLVVTDSNNNVTDAGERVVVDPTALFDSGRAIITTLIPTGSDPCEPDRQGAVLVVDAATGGAGAGVGFGDIKNWPSDFSQAGARVTNVPTNGQLPAASQVGGGQIYLPGISLSKSGATFGFGDAIWRRRSWRVLNNGNN
jgi:type IV pilus assembly protein PilY1